MTAKVQHRRLAPLSIRLNERERAQLEKAAGDMPLGRFIKQQVFYGTPKASKAEVVDRYEMLARLLAALGETDAFANLDSIAKAVECGDVQLSAEQLEQIGATCLLVLEMRNDLIRALGLKPPPVLEGSDDL